MANEGGWLDRFVDDLPNKRWFRFLSTYVVVPYWAWRQPTPKLPGGPRSAPQPSENNQRMMNLVMPLRDTTPLGRAEAALAIAQNVDQIFSGLDNVGTVHFARFVIIENNICMISVYDGDLSNYIRDFVITIGGLFDDVLYHVEGGDALRPVTKNVDTVIDWLCAHDLFQAPDFPTDIFALQDAAKGLPPGERAHDIQQLGRALILQMRANPSLSLGGGYRSYPGYSAAQVRQKLGIGT